MLSSSLRLRFQCDVLLSYWLGMSHRDIEKAGLPARTERGSGMLHTPPKPIQSQSLEAVAAEIGRLSNLPTKDLKAAWAAEFRRPAPKGLWKDLLLRILAWRLQEKTFGGHDKSIAKLLEAHGQKRRGDQRSRRLKPGTVLVREFSGIRYTVMIVPEGFIWQERTYASLTAIARIITGTNWNGPRFFGLREGEGKNGGKPQSEAAA